MHIIEPWLVGKVMGSVVPTIGRPIHPHTIPFFTIYFPVAAGGNHGCAANKRAVGILRRSVESREKQRVARGSPNTRPA